MSPQDTQWICAILLLNGLSFANQIYRDKRAVFKGLSLSTHASISGRVSLGSGNNPHDSGNNIESGFGAKAFNTGGIVKELTLHKQTRIPFPQIITVPVVKKIPYPVKVPVPVEVNRPFPVEIPQPYPYPVHIIEPYSVRVTEDVPVPVGVPFGVPALVDFRNPYQLVIHDSAPAPASKYNILKKLKTLLVKSGNVAESFIGGVQQTLRSAKNSLSHFGIH